ncbi:hypothetical protein JCM19233_5542 [Vibrio astriarenae]|nr:hypothetical protein JCM19233_5542 [Vibrio sp. C7]
MTSYNLRWVEDDPLPIKVKPPLSEKEKNETRIQRQVKEREDSWKEIQASEARYATHREKVLAERCAAKPDINDVYIIFRMKNGS